MAEVPVTMNGVLYDLYGRTTQRVVFIGDASLTGLSVGGGPIMPPSGGGQPPGIWGGGNVPMPTPPIPIYPGGTPNPPGIWGPTDPRPGVGPIIPPEQPPEGPTDDNGFVKPPPGDGGWSYHETYGWGYYPGATAAGPKRPS